MNNAEFRDFSTHWNQILAKQESAKKAKKQEKSSFFTNTIIPNEDGPSDLLVEQWKRILKGADDIDIDRIKSIRSKELMSDQKERIVDDFGEQPPVGILNEEIKRHEKRLQPIIAKKFLSLKEAANKLNLQEKELFQLSEGIWKNIFPDKKFSVERIEEVKKIKKLFEKKEADDEEESDLSKDGFGKLVRGDRQVTKGDITYQNQPITPSSVGNDASQTPLSPVRVTKDFSDGEQLDKLGVLKRKLEFWERRVHRADTEKNEAKRSKLAKEIKKLRKEIDEISDEMQSKPDKDVT